jgi:TldD protein
MSDPMQLANERLVAGTGLQVADIEATIAELAGGRVDAADVYLEHNRTEGWSLDDGIVKDSVHSISQGVGVRATVGERTGFAHSAELSPAALLEAARTARAIARAGQSGEVAVTGHGPVAPLYGTADPIEARAADEKVALLRRLDALARSLDPRVSQVSISLTGQHSVVMVADHAGHLTADVRPLVRLNVSVVVEAQGRRETGTAGGGGRHGYDWLFEEGAGEHMVREAVRLALVNLEADAAPAGEQTVVLGPGWPGILLHEAIGHGLEGDFNRKGSSAFAGRIGERVAAPGVTVVDDGTLPGRRGSLNVDDEGTPTSCTTLIEDGILKGYLQDRLNARLMGAAPTGNGRRQSWAHRPMPRMTNTYMLNGQHDPGEIIASVERGIYAVNFGGGQVDITNGKFVFTTSEAYLIEHGQVTRPVRGATLIGNGPDVLTRVSMVGNDLALDSGIGTCGKLGQGVPVGVGQPTLRVDRLTVGGTG